MQSALLPQESPDLQGLEFAEEVQVASRVSGDFYTYVELDGGKWAMVAVDVCGQGMEGAVTVLRFSETLRDETRGRAEPDDVCRLYLLLRGPPNFTSAHPVCRTAVSTST
jgi:serine phosphatase RsbU (regulator of sigma subunit)